MESHAFCYAPFPPDPLPLANLPDGSVVLGLEPLDGVGQGYLV